MKLFNLVNGVLQLNNTEVLLINDFDALLRRDNTIGKLVAWNEFKFIYYVVDPLSFPNQNGYNEKATLKFACNECGFKEDYKPDPLVTKALRKYVELRSSIVAEVCQELLITFRSSAEVLRKIRSKIEDLLNRDILTSDEIREVTNLQREIMSIASSIPDSISKITNAQKELENSGKELLRGKHEMSDSMDPKQALG